MDADSFLDHIVAHARVGASIDALQNARPFTNRFALEQLKEDLQKGGSYVEEAVRLDVTGVMTRVMKACPDDEAVMDAAARVIALCSGTMACAGRVLAFDYGNGASVRIREGPLGDGLGARVWAIAHALCRELAGAPAAVAGLDVLEIGAGTGLCGIVAAKLGARRVVLTDNEPPVLENLRTCMHLNAGADGRSCPGTSAADYAGPSGGGGPSDGPKGEGPSEAAAADGCGAGEEGGGGHFHGITDAELFDDAESVDDLDFSELACAGGSGAYEQGNGHGPGPGGGGRGAAGAAQAAAARGEWEAANMEVRLLDWRDSLDVLDGGGARADALDAGAAPAAAAGGEGAPSVPEAENFALILGNETMYEPEHATLVAAVIAQRLAPGGRALLCSAVRFKDVFEAFRAACAGRGLRHRSARVWPRPEDCDGGILRDDYDGGFLLIAVDWADTPSSDWHRDNFE